MATQEKLMVKLEEADIAQLRFIASEILNLDIDNINTSSKIRAVIEAASEVTQFELPVEFNKRRNKAAPPAAPKGKRKNTTHDYESPREGFIKIGKSVVPIDSEGKVTVTIAADEDDQEEFMTLSVNGSNMLVPLGEPCAIPPTYAEVLMNSRKKVPVQDRNMRIVGWKEVPARQFSINAPMS